MKPITAIISTIYQNRNAITGRIYQGINNQIRLQSAGFKSKLRMTYYQALQAGYKIKKGSKGVIVVYHFDSMEDQNQNTTQKSEPAYKVISGIKRYCVFNIDQTEKSNASHL